MTLLDVLIFSGIIFHLFNPGISQNVVQHQQTYTLPPYRPRVSNVISQPVAADYFTLGPPRPPQVLKPHAGYEHVALADCSTPSLTVCSQAAWADLSITLAGLTGISDLCVKYTPEHSCVSSALDNCGLTMNGVSQRMLIGIAKILIAWCYDGGNRMREIDSQASCYAAALIHAVLTDNCLEDKKPMRTAAIGFLASAGSKLGVSQSGVFNGLLGYYQISTVKCIFRSINLTCGLHAAELALGPGMDEINFEEPKTTVSPPTTLSTPAHEFLLDNVHLRSVASKHCVEPRKWTEFRAALTCVLIGVLASLLTY